MKPLVCVLAILLALTATALAAPYKETPGPLQVKSLEATWKDPTRNREVPILICYPADLATEAKPLPVIVFSHGLGGSREGYRAYGEHWASYGYVVIFPQHHGSDSAVIGHGMAAMLNGKNDLQPFLDRACDIHFVLDQVQHINAGQLKSQPNADYTPFKNKLDLAAIGMSGHSFGAITTQAIVGQQYRVATKALADPRVKAGIAMSGSGAKDTDSAGQDKAFAAIKIPMLYLTGTDDKIGAVGPADRRIPFDHSTFKDTYLVTFTGANHMTFAPMGRGLRADKEKYQKLIRQCTTAFWDANLKHDPKAKAWLTNDFPKEMGKLGVLETKAAKN